MKSVLPRRGGTVSSACQGCGSRRSAYSERMGAMCCLSCYQASFSREVVAESDRAHRQRAIARSIRRAAERVADHRRQKLLNRALLIETAASVGEVEMLLGVVERLGIAVRRRRS